MCWPRIDVLGVSDDTGNVCDGYNSPRSGLVTDEHNSFYQEFLGKTLTDKYTTLNMQMDKVVHNANSEISTLQSRLSGWSAPRDFVDGFFLTYGLVRHANGTRSATEEKPRAIRNVPRQVQEVHPNYQSLQSFEVASHEIANADSRVRLGVSSVGLDCAFTASAIDFGPE